MKKAREIMTPEPSSCHQEQSAYDAVRIMERENCGSVPVVGDSSEPVGMVTDRDICLRVVLDGKDPRAVQLRDIMTRDPAICSLDDDLESVIELMERRQVRRVPVVDDRGRLMGIIAQADIARNVNDEEKVREMLEMIST